MMLRSDVKTRSIDTTTRTIWTWRETGHNHIQSNIWERAASRAESLLWGNIGRQPFYLSIIKLGKNVSLPEFVQARRESTDWKSFKKYCSNPTGRSKLLLPYEWKVTMVKDHPKRTCFEFLKVSTNKQINKHLRFSWSKLNKNGQC